MVPRRALVSVDVRSRIAFGGYGRLPQKTLMRRDVKPVRRCLRAPEQSNRPSDLLKLSIQMIKLADLMGPNLLSGRPAFRVPAAGRQTYGYQLSALVGQTETQRPHERHKAGSKSMSPSRVS